MPSRNCAFRLVARLPAEFIRIESSTFSDRRSNVTCVVCFIGPSYIYMYVTLRAHGITTDGYTFLFFHCFFFLFPFLRISLSPAIAILYILL